MNRDLEEQLAEMGGEYRAVVDRLRSARTVSPRATVLETLKKPERGARPVLVRVGWLVAASLFVAIGLAIVFERPAAPSLSGSVYTIAYAPTEEALGRIVASQRADGSWENDFITCQNAAALRHGVDAGSRIAYKKAVRYLRSRGLSPLTDEELRDRKFKARDFI